MSSFLLCTTFNGYAQVRTCGMNWCVGSVCSCTPDLATRCWYWVTDSWGLHASNQGMTILKWVFSKMVTTYTWLPDIQTQHVSVKIMNPTQGPLKPRFHTMLILLRGLAEFFSDHYYGFSHDKFNVVTYFLQWSRHTMAKSSDFV